jgi:4-hydroxy-3-methylbut-2-enyl diphosphate reductase
VKALAEKSDLILVVGAQNSSNSNRLVSRSSSGTSAYLIANARDIQAAWISGCSSVGVTAGASTPEILVQAVVENLRMRGFTNVEELEIIEEDVHFPLPAPLEQYDRVIS